MNLIIEIILFSCLQTVQHLADSMLSHDSAYDLSVLTHFNPI